MVVMMNQFSAGKWILYQYRRFPWGIGSSGITYAIKLQAWIRSILDMISSVRHVLLDTKVELFTADSLWLRRDGNADSTTFHRDLVFSGNRLETSSMKLESLNEKLLQVSWRLRGIYFLLKTHFIRAAWRKPFYLWFLYISACKFLLSFAPTFSEHTKTGLNHFITSHQIASDQNHAYPKS